jgi:hypothetical protein
MRLLTSDMKQVAAQPLARAQLLFDCWQRQSACMRADEAPCADEFHAALKELEPIADTFVTGSESVRILSFDGATDALTEPSRQAVEMLAARLKDAPDYMISARAFPDPKNRSHRDLSIKRLDAVQRAFIMHGVQSGRIELEGLPDPKEVQFGFEEARTHRDRVKITVKTLTGGH